ncbi:MAG: hypothetical protein UF433_12260, partial [Clostridium sp.]|nr:hypothetical protein [Clostridium sp.]
FPSQSVHEKETICNQYEPSRVFGTGIKFLKTRYFEKEEGKQFMRMSWPDLKRDSQVSLHMVRWTKGGKEYGSEISQREADTDSLHLLFLFIDSLFVRKI